MRIEANAGPSVDAASAGNMARSKVGKVAEAEVQARSAIGHQAEQSYRRLIKAGVKPEPVAGTLGTNCVDPGKRSVRLEVIRKESYFTRREALGLGGGERGIRRPGTRVHLRRW